MKRSNEYAVGLTVVVAIVVVVAGALLLGQIRLGRGDEVRTARFRSPWSPQYCVAPSRSSSHHTSF